MLNNPDFTDNLKKISGKNNNSRKCMIFQFMGNSNLCIRQLRYDSLNIPDCTSISC
ncbi:unnamed protein product, partial [Brugia timori]|uniref:Uncharacterized protein n=1 Tax=Brugia timori TaxID=42155 RepID=A0A0R3R3B3_9BILA